MSEGLNRSIRQETIGYSMQNEPHRFDAKVNSINEILHLIHSTIVNDEKILKSLPILQRSKNSSGTTVLYGTTDSENPVARNIYEQIKEGKESYTDIVSSPDRTLMMVRDRGHALTLDIAKDPHDGRYYVNYFIPKICNVDKVNALPGVRKIIKNEGESQIREFTNGVFSVPDEDDAASSVVKFIDMVPTDKDIDFPSFIK